MITQVRIPHRPRSMLAVALLALLVGACGQSPAANTPGATATSADATAEPDAAEGDAATPDTAATPFVVPTPGEATGVVHGVLRNADENIPLTAETTIDIYLSAMLPSDQEGVEFAALDTANDPRTGLMEGANFVFTDIAPGRYTIITRGALNPVMVREDIQTEDPQDVVFDVEAGETIDVGVVYTRYP